MKSTKTISTVVHLLALFIAPHASSAARTHIWNAIRDPQGNLIEIDATGNITTRFDGLAECGGFGSTNCTYYLDLVNNGTECVQINPIWKFNMDAGATTVLTLRSRPGGVQNTQNTLTGWSDRGTCVVGTSLGQGLKTPCTFGGLVQTPIQLLPGATTGFSVSFSDSASGLGMLGYADITSETYNDTILTLITRDFAFVSDINATGAILPNFQINTEVDYETFAVCPSPSPSEAPSTSQSPTTSPSTSFAPTAACDRECGGNPNQTPIYITTLGKGKCVSACVPDVLVEFKRGQGWECGVCPDE